MFTDTRETFLRLFDPDGREIELERLFDWQFPSIENMQMEAGEFLWVVNASLRKKRSGSYWLISKRPGRDPMLLRITLHPRLPDEPVMYLEYTDTGRASDPAFDLANVVDKFRKDMPGYTQIPDNVAALAMEHVRYRSADTRPISSWFRGLLRSATPQLAM